MVETKWTEKSEPESGGEGAQSAIAREGVDDAYGPRPAPSRDRAAAVSPGDYNFKLKVDGRERDYDVHVPKGYDGSRPLPLMIVLHGVAGDNRKLMETDTGLNKVADEKNMIVVYAYAADGTMPGSLGMSTVKSWNSPGAGLTAFRPGYDDVNYIKAIVNQIPGKLNVDEKARYIVGFSEGGEFAQHTVGRLPGTFAGVGSVHGTLRGTEAKPLPGDRTAFIVIHGDADYMLPLSGGRGPMTVTMPKAADSRPLEQKYAWARANDCVGAPTVTDTPAQTVTEYTARQCDGVVVKEIVRKGGFFAYGKHSWDGRLGVGGWDYVGDKDPGFEVSRELTEFLLKHRKSENVFPINRTLGKGQEFLNRQGLPAISKEIRRGPDG